MVVPGYQRFAATAATLETAVSDFCAQPTPERLQAARGAFEQAMLAWQHVQPIVFGPIAAEARASRIQLFPDKTGAVSRQLNRALADQEPGLVAPGGLEGKSVALTGFPALEQILYDDARLPAAGGSGPDADYACALAAAIARNLAGLAAGVLDDWQRPGGFRDMMLTAAAGNDAYFAAEEASGDLIKSLHTALQSVIAVETRSAARGIARPGQAQTGGELAQRAVACRHPRQPGHRVRSLRRPGRLQHRAPGDDRRGPA